MAVISWKAFCVGLLLVRKLIVSLQVGMNREAVQHERGPRNATIRKQMADMMTARQVCIL